jgi:hypothetical protein
MTFNRSQYEHHLSPHDCPVLIQLPPIHEKTSVAWLFQCLRRFGPSGVAALLFLRLNRNIQEQLNPGFRNRRSSRWLPFTKALCSFELFEPETDVVHMRWFPSKYIPELTLSSHYPFRFRDQQDTLRFFRVCSDYQQRATAMADWHTLRRCDLERALGEDTRCVTELV